MLSKKEIRLKIKQIRSALSDEEVVIESQKINQNFLENLLPKIYPKNSNKIFSLYFAANNEVTTTLIADYFSYNNILFSYPKIIQKNQPLKFILSEKNQDFAPNFLYPSIVEPVGKIEIWPDIVILPLLAFDFQLNRIGSGAGFFDRTIALLKSKKPEIINIGLAYDFQGLTSPIPYEETDQKLDFIVTSKTIIAAEAVNS